MRLGIEIATCTQARTGVGYYTEHLVDALLETRGAGDEVVLLSNKAPSPELGSRWSAHLRVSGRNMRAAWMQLDVPRLLSETRVDVAVFPNYVVPLASPCTSVVVVHDLTVLRMPQYCTLRKRLLMRLMLRHSIAAASLVATVSDASKRDIETFLDVSPERIALLPGAAHPSCRRAAPDVVRAVQARYGLTRPYVLTVGTLEPRKDLMTLLRAFDRLGSQAREHELVVVGGRGWRDRQLVRELKRRAAEKRVRWLGYVDEPDLVALYTGADLFVLTSTFEGFGLPVLEAMACGTPVIASDVAALREVGGNVARYVPVGDVAAFASAIERSLGDPQQTALARSAGPAHASEFSWIRTAEALWARVRVAGPTRVSTPVTTTANGTPANTATPAASASARRGADPLPPPVHPPPAGLNAREWALFAAVVYADLFDSALPVERLLSASIGVVFDEAEVHRLVRGASLTPLLTLHPAGFLVLAGREHLVDAIPEREQRARALVERTRSTLAILSRLPFIRALVTSGGIVHRNAGARPDVDLFVVAARDRLYTAYTLLVLATKLTGTRQLICPNYLVDESDLAIAYHRDLFTAHQLVSARPLAGQTAYEALCHANETWIRHFFPSFAAHPPREGNDQTPKGDQPSAWQRAGEGALWPLEPALERLLRTAWRMRLRRRAATAPRADVVVSDGILKLHLSDYRRRTLERFAARLAAHREQIDAHSQPPVTSLEPVGT
jgi:glycosyltransferase involved in cell wall biosynthesis